jgi:ubiquitin carboxyl-terminal hydrolase 36/42
VNARKHFTIEKAPQILHIHLKRFTPTGKKLTGAIGYPETLHLDAYMSGGTADVSLAFCRFRIGQCSDILPV